MASSTGTGAGVFQTSPTITTPTISSLSSASATALTLQSAGTTAVTVDTSQNVGIGTTSPINNSGYGGLSVNGTNGTIVSLMKAGTETGRIFTGGDETNISYKASTGYLTFVQGVSGGTERMRITSSGQLTAGNSGTGYGSITGGNISGFDPSATNAYQKAAITATGAYGGGLCVLDSAYGWVMYGLTNGADFYIRRGSSGTALSGGVYLSNGATSWSAASDERLKNIKRPITNALEKLKDYRCVIGEYKDNLGVERPFLIAQDVRATFPEAVNVMDKDEGYLGMSYADMIPLLTKSIQELKAINDTQAETINALTARIEALEGK
jgi:hypothetical protein